MDEHPILKPQPTLSDIQAYIAAMVAHRGFQDNIDVLPQRFMLLLEECGEFARAARKTVGLKFAANTHTAELDEEAADILIILTGICNMLHIDLEQALRAKEEKNKQRTWR